MTGDREPRLRVAFVLGSAAGGTAGHARALADGARAAGWSVTAYGPAETLARLPDDMDTAVVEIGDRPRPARDTVTIVRLRAYLAANRPDVVHAHGVRAGAFAALALATMSVAPTANKRLGKCGRPALAVTVHNAPPDGRAARMIYGLLEQICARRAAIVLCASADLVTRMSARGARAEQFDVSAQLRPDPTAAQVATARADLAAGERPVVLAVARLAQQKGLDVLIDAAGRWRDRDPEPRTVIAGAGPLAAALRAQAKQVGADVALLGARDDVPALLAAADVVVVPSRWEARALIIQEAMRAGRPIVATRVGGTPELTGADGAILVPPEDTVALAEAVAAVLDDPALAGRLGAAAQQRSVTFPSQQDAIGAALAIYARLTPRQPARRDNNGASAT